ncbi:MAG: hypothetical protein AAF843_14080 [Bacteroidota bacterium]
MLIKRIFGIIYILFAIWFAYIRRDVITGAPSLDFDYISSIVIPIGLIALGIFRIRK